MTQIFLTLLIFVLLVVPFGKYLYNVAEQKTTPGEPVFAFLDNIIYRLCGVDKTAMSWKRYAAALILTNAVMFAAAYLILRLQSIPFLNPNGIAAMPPDLAFNTAISFITNTNLQHYAGENGVSYLSQAAVMTFLMFTSAATGYAACMAFIRGLAGKEKTLGNFYVDVIRVTTRVLLPLSILISVLLLWQGVPQNFSKNITLTTIENKYQDIAMGPVASLESIKHLGTNGGGFFAANSAHPSENPTPLTNIIEMLSMMLLPGACVIVFGRMVFKRRKENKQINSSFAVFGSEGRAVFTAMALLFMALLFMCFYAEHAGNPVLTNLGINQSMGSMEGKEMRFGVDQSALFTVTTTTFTTGSVNNMHDTLTPLGGMSAMLGMMLNAVYGGVGAGLMNMLTYALLAVFLCGLMIGRTPEYLGKKIAGKEMQLVALCLMAHPFVILIFTALAVSTAAGFGSVSNPGFHGLSQMLYEYSSAAANNGSGFAGLYNNTFFWNITTGLAMFFGRFVPIILQLAAAGLLAAQNNAAPSKGALRTNTFMFSIILAVTVVIFAALTFLPVLSLGPIAEHLTLWGRL